ncbi:MAG: signal peptidase II [Ruminococcaceae bacterium]|nr:signal peptidase II [Oscillospiraceae bacterium]
MICDRIGHDGGIVLIWCFVILACVIIDQLTKWAAVAFLDGEEPFSLIDGVFRFTYVENDGAAFGMLDDHRWVFMVLSCVGIGALCVYLWKVAKDKRLEGIAVSMIIGGGIGNMIDRVRLGYVVDFLDFCAFPKIWPWVFNMADAFVCVGGGLLILSLTLEIIAESKAKRNSAQDGGNKEGNDE